MDFIPIDFAHEDQIWVQECMERLTSAFELASSGSGYASSGRFLWPPPETEVAAILLADALLAFEFPTHTQPAQDTTRAITEVAVGSVAAWLFNLVRTPHEGSDEAGSHLLQAIAAQRAAQLYTRFRSQKLRGCEGKLLQVLLSTSIPSAIAVGVDLLVDQPPREWSEGGLAVSILVQSNHWRVSDVFPRILDSTNPSVLAPAIDLANLLVRERGVTPHPAADRFDALLSLLGGVTQQLALLEEDPSQFSNRVSEVQRILFDGVSLAVSLCHFFSLQGDARAIGKLTQALDLSHRRIKAEAAFALAKLGDERAVELLLQLVEDDANRPRLLAYAEELGIDGRIDPKWYSALARAKSQLALWLSQPEQFSLAPQGIELLDQRTLPWPGMEAPQDCFLLRFEYTLGDAHYTNIGFAGPIAHAFPFDLSGLEFDELFGMFLAKDIDDPWATRDLWDSSTRRRDPADEVLLSQLADDGFTGIQPCLVIEFLSKKAVVADAVANNQDRVCAIHDGENLIVCSASSQAREYLIARWMGRLALHEFGL